jgi:hypothetical protein
MILITAASLPGFQVPSEMLLRHGKLILAPTDGRCLLCLDAATGEVEWLLTPAQTDYIVGDDGERLFLAGKRLLCVALRTGIQLWDIEVPEPQQGRGLVAGGLVLLPGDRRFYVLPTTGNATWQARDLPRFLQGQETPLTRPNLQLAGPYLVATHAGGIEVFGLVRVLRAMAAQAPTPAQRARLLEHAGDLPGAIAALAQALEDTAGAEARAELVRELLPLVHEVALAMAVVQQRDPALQLLEVCRRWLQSADEMQRWHLARVEVLRALADETAAMRELELLRDLATGGPR